MKSVGLGMRTVRWIRKLSQSLSGPVFSVRPTVVWPTTRTPLKVNSRKHWPDSEHTILRTLSQGEGGPGPRRCSPQ